jgi:hypothetical protein
MLSQKYKAHKRLGALGDGSTHGVASRRDVATTKEDPAELECMLAIYAPLPPRRALPLSSSTLWRPPQRHREARRSGLHTVAGGPCLLAAVDGVLLTTRTNGGGERHRAV